MQWLMCSVARRQSYVTSTAEREGRRNQRVHVTVSITAVRCRACALLSIVADGLDLDLDSDLDRTLLGKRECSLPSELTQGSGEANKLEGVRS